MTVVEIARQAGISAQAVRYYERRGLLAKARRRHDSGYRDFDPDSVVTLRFIAAAKSAGFTLKEIRELLDLRLPPRGSCAEVETIFNAKVAEFDRRIAELRQMRATLRGMANACRGRDRSQSCLALWRMETGDRPSDGRRGVWKQR